MPSNEAPSPAIISTGWRWATGVACVAALGSGGVAVFTTDNEVGSTALLAVGLYFAIVTAMGRFPRIKLGDNEIDPGVIAAAAQSGADLAADAAAQAALDKKPPEEVAQAARDVEKSISRSFTLRVPAKNEDLEAFRRWLRDTPMKRDWQTWSEEKAADDTDRGD